MKLKKFLSGNHPIHEDIKIRMVLDECSDIIDLYRKTGGLFYRGVNYDLDIIEKKYPRNNRQPLNTKREMSEVFDAAFKEYFGWEARSEGVFATSDFYECGLYGNTTGIFFPKNGFKYIWSPKINDLYLFSSFSSPNDKIFGVIRDNYIDNNIEKAVKSNHEVMFKCNHYYLLEPKFVANHDDLFKLGF